MTFIAEGFAEVTVEIQIPGDAGPAFVVFGVRPSALGITLPIIDTADNVGDTLNNSPGLMDPVTSDNAITGFVVRQRTGPGTVAIEERALAVAGKSLAGSAPPQVAWLLQKQTGLAGRQNRGRMYVPGVREVIVDTAGNIINPDYANAQTAFTAFFNDLATNNVPMYILHTSPVIAPTEVTSLQLSRKVATQRRRLR
jgi:hypothetical protein